MSIIPSTPGTVSDVLVIGAGRPYDQVTDDLDAHDTLVRIG
jgi:hypothetical protein